jgi:hypothetical protein
MWALAGLAFGTVLGLAAAFGGFIGFVLVLVLGVVGFLAGRAYGGEIDLADLFSRHRAAGGR